MNIRRECMIISVGDKTFPIQVAGSTEYPYFRSQDVCALLGHKSPSQALQLYVKDEDKNTLATVTTDYGLGKENFSEYEGQTIYVSESGFYALISNSKVPFIKEFEKVVRESIISDIHKFGLRRLESRLANLEGQMVKIERQASIVSDISLEMERRASLASTTIEGMERRASLVSNDSAVETGRRASLASDSSKETTDPWASLVADIVAATEDKPRKVVRKVVINLETEEGNTDHKYLTYHLGEHVETIDLAKMDIDAVREYFEGILEYLFDGPM